MIEILNASKIIKGKTILDNVTLKINDGECIAVTGYNGCGKTMLLRLICGLIKPTSGEIKYDKDYSFGVVIENSAFFLNETAMYNLKYLANINKQIETQDIEKYLKIFNLYEAKDKKVSTFSLGMKQRLALCQAFMENPDVIILDEPFNALDDKNLKITAETISQFKNSGKIIVIAMHGNIPEECEVDRIIKMGEGVIERIEQKEP